jgi:hypothetical protein
MADLNSARTATASGRADTAAATATAVDALAAAFAAINYAATLAGDVVRLKRAELELDGFGNDPNPFIDQLAENAVRLEQVASGATATAAEIKAAVVQMTAP